MHRLHCQIEIHVLLYLFIYNWIIHFLSNFNIHIHYFFLFLGLIPLENFSLTCRLTITGLGLQILCSALMAIEQWGFFSVPFLLWHGASVYNGHLRGPVTLTPWQWSFENLFLRFWSDAARIRTPNLPLVGQTLKPTGARCSYISVLNTASSAWLKNGRREFKSFSLNTNNTQKGDVTDTDVNITPFSLIMGTH